MNNVEKIIEIRDKELDKYIEGTIWKKDGTQESLGNVVFSAIESAFMYSPIKQIN